MEREDWMHVGMVVSGAALGLAARVFFQEQMHEKSSRWRDGCCPAHTEMR